MSLFWENNEMKSWKSACVKIPPLRPSAMLQSLAQLCSLSPLRSQFCIILRSFLWTCFYSHLSMSSSLAPKWDLYFSKTYYFIKIWRLSLVLRNIFPLCSICFKIRFSHFLYSYGSSKMTKTNILMLFHFTEKSKSHWFICTVLWPLHSSQSPLLYLICLRNPGFQH